ncbi:hypothetical protein [Microbispora sp. CA-102843]
MMRLFVMGVAMSVAVAVARLVPVLVAGCLIRCRVMRNCHGENAS